MTYRVVQFHGSREYRDDIIALGEAGDVVKHWRIDLLPKGFSHAFLVRTQDTQPLTDKLQPFLTKDPSAHVVVLPVEAVMPMNGVNGGAPTAEAAGKKKSVLGISREELYEDISRGVSCDMTFYMMVLLSTIVAAIGLIEDNVAVVIGAMVIAPFLGPNLALALASVLGDRDLMGRAIATNVRGFALTFIIAFFIGSIWPGLLDSNELLSRTDVGFDGIVLAVAAGAAAVLSITSGLSSVLVGVMVAVALLPPAATMGIMAGAGEYALSFGAGLLLLVNVVSVNLAAKVVFIYKGVQPRTWYKQKKAREARSWYLLFWMITLAFLIAIIYLRQHKEWFIAWFGG